MKTFTIFLIYMLAAAIAVFFGLQSKNFMSETGFPAFIWLLPFTFAYDVLSRIVGVRGLNPLTYNERAAGFILSAVFLLLLQRVY
jgi:hypothetical protein